MNQDRPAEVVAPVHSPHDDADLGAYRARRDAALRVVILDRYDSVAQHAAGRFRNRGEPFDDLLQVARIGLLKALERYEPQKGSGFPAYAMATAVGEIRRHFRDATWRVHIPRRPKEMQTRLRDAIETLGADLRRAPTPAELARYLDVAEDVVLDALDAAAANRTSSIDEHGRTDGGLPIASTLVAQDQSADEIVLVRDLLARLPARERRIVEMRFFMGSNQQEIAQHLRISQVHVSRLLRSALLTLRRTLTDETQA